jgi:hypothetical protein
MSFKEVVLKLRSFVLIALLALVGACGGESTPVSADPDVTVLPSAGGTDSPDSTTKSGDDTGAPSAGIVTIGEETWQFASRQCSVYAADTVSVWGSAVSDPGVEITFDVFGVDQFNFEVDVDGAQWTAASDSIEATVTGKDVTGTATVRDVNNGGSSTATFEFHCG